MPPDLGVVKEYKYSDPEPLVTYNSTALNPLKRALYTAVDLKIKKEIGKEQKALHTPQHPTTKE